MMQGISRRTRRTMRRARRRRATELNIVSMIDILTVLVFFLLVNSTGVAVVNVSLPSSEAASKPPQHSLTLTIRADGLSVADNGTTLRRFAAANGHYDLSALADFLQSVKQRIPGDNNITLLLEPGIAYGKLIRVMDVVRTQPTPDGRGRRKLFPDISLGDAPGSTSNVGVRP